MLIPGLGQSSHALAADQWTNLTGTSSVSGELLGIWNGRVLLKLEGGRRVSVKMSDLRAESRIQAEKRFDELRQLIVNRSGEIRVVAGEASAPAPKEMAAAIPPPAYQPVADNLDLQQSLTVMSNQLLAGHARVLYDSLPNSQRLAFDQWFAAAVKKIDPQSFDSARNTLASVGDLIVSRQRWLFSHPMLEPMIAGNESQWLALGATMQSLFAEDVTGVQGLRTRPPADSIAKVDEALAPLLFQTLGGESASSLAAILGQVQTAPTQDGGTTVSLTAPVIGPLGSLVMYPAEGRWIWWGDKPETAAARWQQWTQSLAALSDDSVPLNPTMAGAIRQLDESLRGLKAAPNRQAFHRELDVLVPQLLALTQGGITALAGAQGMAGRLGQGSDMMMPGMGGIPMPGMSGPPGMMGAPGMPGAPGMGMPAAAADMNSEEYVPPDS